MRQLHELVRAYGPQEGLRRAEEQGETTSRRVMDAIRRFYEFDDELAVMFSGFCVLGLPHRQLASPEDKFRRILRRGDCSWGLVVEPGEILVRGQMKVVGVPFGPAARLILLWLQKEALSRKSREIELGASMNDWLKRMDMTSSGYNYARVRDQTLRLAAASMRLTFSGPDSQGNEITAFEKEPLITCSEFVMSRADNSQSWLWQDRIVLSETFYKALCEHPVPLSLAAVRAISQSSRALDIYCWLAYRLHTLGKQRSVSWSALKEQFGQEFSQLFHFKAKFQEALDLARSVYEQARIEVTARGLTLYPSPPPVAERALRQVLLPEGGLRKGIADQASPPLLSLPTMFPLD